MKKYLTTKEAAEYIRRSPRTLSRYCQEGRINYRPSGRSNFFTIEDLDNFVEADLVEAVA